MARGWLKLSPEPLETKLLETHLSKAQTFKSQDGNNLYHLVNFHPEGYLIVATESDLEPVIAFSPHGKYQASTENPLYNLLEADMHSRVKSLSVHKPFRLQVSKESLKWKRLIQAGSAMQPQSASGLVVTDDMRVAPFVLTQWSQQGLWNGSTLVSCYNYYTPPYAAGTVSNYPSGCVPTAFAQIMRYFNYPNHSVGTTQFEITVDESVTMRRLQGGNGFGGPYEWDQMPLILSATTTDEQRRAIGALIADIGTATGTSYQKGSSSTSVDSARRTLLTTFSYGGAVLYRGLDGTRNPINAINANLDARLPVLLAIHGGFGNHMAVCDGYGYNLVTPYHHLNLGWGGSENAWYNIPNIDTGHVDFDSVASFIYNIYTDTTGEIVSGQVRDTNNSPISHASITILWGATNLSTKADQWGVYAFTRLPSNTTFNLSAEKEGFEFEPQLVTTGYSKSPWGANEGASVGNKWGVDFIGIPKLPQPLESLSITYISDGLLWLILSGPVGNSYIIKSSSNLVNWLPFSTNTIPPSGSVLIADPSVTKPTRQFYRL